MIVEIARFRIFNVLIVLRQQISLQIQMEIVKQQLNDIVIWSITLN